MCDKDQIRRHYNRVPNKTIQERENTKNINIRKFNNFIKAVLFNELIQRGDTILDIGFGKGGDIKKYASCGVKEVYGLDCANLSILEALKRARDIKPPFFMALKTRDCYTEKIDLKKIFDVVSIQFSFHYCFQKESHLEITLDNISRHLHPRGKVLLTVPSKRVILERKEANKLSNELFKIEFNQYNVNTPYGQNYYFYLVDSLDNCIEYLIDKNELKEKLKKYNLRITLEQKFDEFYYEHINKYKFEHNRIIGDLELTQDDWDVVELYEVIVIEKF